MCGIFGIAVAPDSQVSSGELKRLMKRLFLLSESRGKEASGAIFGSKEEIIILKEPVTAKKMIRASNYRKTIEKVVSEGGKGSTKLLIGHSRLVTNGKSQKNSNNQPIMKSGAALVHNGIITNSEDIWKQHSDKISATTEVDSEVIADLISLGLKEGRSIQDAIGKAYREIVGAASIAFTIADMNILALATNTGSLYCCLSTDRKAIVFASERFILKEAIAEARSSHFQPSEAMHIKPRSGCIFVCNDAKFTDFSFESVVAARDEVDRLNRRETTLPQQFTDPSDIETEFKLSGNLKDQMIDNWRAIYDGRARIVRCSKCIMPATTPYITFDEKGVCNYCRNFEKRENKVFGTEALKEELAKFKSETGDQDCIVGFSGGRDSSYGIFLLKEQYGMNPIAFTYDWGMVNDLARRNQSLVCSKMGIEQILVSADLTKKRINIQKNLEAWLSKPELGMIPLLMAGDKQFYYFFHKIRRQAGLRLFVFCGGHEIEETPFKYGFSGVEHGVDNVMNRLTGISQFNKVKLMSYYIVNYIKNPKYINASIIDTLFAYYSTYFLKDDYLYLYHYIKWDEDMVVKTIIDEFDWERAKDTEATWRIDDGTAAFYNYVYLTMAGFTEFDNFRSYQVREGIITRERALELAESENKPRIEMIEWYANTVGVDCNRAIEVINKAKKEYALKMSEGQ